jgi:hypothetical protein
MSRETSRLDDRNLSRFEFALLASAGVLHGRRGRQFDARGLAFWSTQKEEQHAGAATAPTGLR